MVKFDNIDVNWWYGMVPQQYEQLHLRNFYIMNDRTLDDPYLDLSVSKHNFAAHPGNYDSTIGAYDESAFIALPDGATFDVISFWLQCDWQCELHIYEQRPNEEEHELLLTTNETPLILEGALATGMAFINLEETFGPGAGKKVVWLRMWARNVTCSGPSGEVAIAMDDLVVARREKSGLSEAGCAELLNTSDAVRWDSDVEFPLGSDGWP